MGEIMPQYCLHVQISKLLSANSGCNKAAAVVLSVTVEVVLSLKEEYCAVGRANVVAIVLVSYFERPA